MGFPPLQRLSYGRQKPKEETHVRIHEMHTDRLRAALRTEEKKIQELLGFLAVNDVTPEAVAHQLKDIELGLKHIRKSAGEAQGAHA
jgi:hypothetical protein